MVSCTEVGEYVACSVCSFDLHFKRWYDAVGAEFTALDYILAGSMASVQLILDK